MCCYACGTAKEHFAMHLISTYSTILVKNKEININILIAKGGGGLSPFSPPLVAPLSLLKQKRPFGVMKVVRSFDFSNNGICQKPERASSLLNNLALLSLARLVSAVGIT